MTKPPYIETADLITELTYLRKSKGVTADRLREAQSVVKALGGSKQPFEALKLRLISAIQSLPEQQSKDALLAAYGLVPKYAAPTLKGRRALYGKQVNRKHDTLTSRENAAIDELTIQLLTAHYAGAPIAAKLPLLHGVYIIESLDMSTLICNRQFAHHDQTRKVVSLSDKADRFEYHSNETTQLVALSGCSVKSEPIENGTKHTLLFGKALKRGQSHTFSFRELSDDPPVPDIKKDRAGQSFETSAYFYTQTVVFKGDVPETIWWYDKLSWVERPGKPTQKRLLVPCKDTSMVRHEFTQQYGGFFSGIAWEW